MSSAKAQAQSSAKRMQLSRDQKALLETVYAMEKLPDAALRERLGNHLGLTARQVQVWFQNRRQRSKSTPADPPVVDPGVRVTDANAAIVALLVVIELATAPPVIAL